jgi:hypothetical protein
MTPWGTNKSNHNKSNQCKSLATLGKHNKPSAFAVDTPGLNCFAPAGGEVAVAEVEAAEGDEGE